MQPSFKDINYLIFVPKKKLYQSMLASADKSIVIEYAIHYTKAKSGYDAETMLALIKDVLDYDWVFASTIFFRKAEKYVYLYKQRWNIETMFRVHDEARIKTKSKNPVIRLFYFIVGMFLLFIWNLFQKTSYSFKRFVIILCEMMRENVGQIEA